MTARPEFFEVAAQLVPVLLIAAAVDARGWASTQPHTHGEAVGEMIGLVALTVSWLASLMAVAFGWTNDLVFVAVMLGLAIGWTEVTMSIALTHLSRLKHARITRRLRLWSLSAVLAPVAITLALTLRVF